MTSKMSLSIAQVRGVVICFTLLLSFIHSHFIIDLHRDGGKGHQQNFSGRGLRHSRSLDHDASDFLPSQSIIDHLPSIQDAPISNGTIVVQLSGEMGNNLHKLAFARGLQLMAKSDYNLDLQLILRHQDHSKWKSARRNLQKCFPNLRQLDFGAGNTREFDDKKLEQRLWLGTRANSLLLRGNDQESMTQVLENLKNIVSQRHDSPLPPRSDSLRASIKMIALPYVLSDVMVDWHILDRYRDELLEWLQFDFTSCCPSNLPDPDESVFHFRNFVTELQGVTSELGFDELSPNQTANELLGHLQARDKVAITTRFDNEVTQQYVQAFQAKGLQVRVVAGNSPTQDFCFLMKAQKELVGGLRSTFFTWAAFLGIDDDDDDDHHSGIQRVRSYSVNPLSVAVLAAEGRAKNSRHPEPLSLPPHQWNDRVLKSKWTFQVFDVATRDL